MMRSFILLLTSSHIEPLFGCYGFYFIGGGCYIWCGLFYFEAEGECVGKEAEGCYDDKESDYISCEVLLFEGHTYLSLFTSLF